MTGAINRRHSEFLIHRHLPGEGKLVGLFAGLTLDFCAQFLKRNRAKPRPQQRARLEIRGMTKRVGERPVPFITEGNIMRTILCIATVLILAVTARAQVTSSFVRQWGGPGSGDGQFHATHADGFSPLMRIYVCDEASHRIQYFSMNGTFLGKFGQWGRGTHDIVNPVCVTFQPDGTVYVVERDNNRIHYFTPNGSHLGMWGTPGPGDGQFNMPAGAAFAPDGTIFITDRMNHRVQHFTPTGIFLGKFGTQGTGDGQFKEPFGIGVSTSGVVYVADSQNCRVEYFTTNGTFLGKWGSVGNANGQFGQNNAYNNGSAHINIDERGLIYVADPNNNRIQIFDAVGHFIGRIGASYGTGNGLFSFANCAAVAPGRQVYVADETDDLIQQMTVVIGTNSGPQVVTVALPGTNAIGNVLPISVSGQMNK
jgi:sugar lactone lactonase YvrE